MSKASKVTTRSAPVQDASVSGVMVVRAGTITIETETRIELVDTALENMVAREIVLGQWQRVLATELDGPRMRTFRLQAMGVA